MRALPACLTIIVCAGCATASTRENPVREMRDVIRTADMPELRQLTAYEAVYRLRPRLRSWDTSGPRSPRVYLDGVYLGGTEELRAIRMFDIVEIRFLGPGDPVPAMVDGFASGLSGAILLATRARAMDAGADGDPGVSWSGG